MIEDDDAHDEDEREVSTLEDDELVRRLKRWEREAVTHWSRWRREAKRCYDFVAGDQWTADDKAALIDQMRQPIVFNRTGPMVDAVLGAEILNRQEVRYIPREIGDVKVNELLTAAAEWVRDNCDAEDEESDAFSDTVTCGMGWTETRMDYEIDPEGAIVIDRVDPMEVWCDPKARKRNVADKRYVFRASWRNRDELPDEWRGRIGSAGEVADDTNDPGFSRSGPQDDYDDGDEDEAAHPDGAETKGRVWVKQWQWYETSARYLIQDPQTQTTATLDEDEYADLVKQYIAMGLRPPQAAKVKGRDYYQAFVVGSVVLEKTKLKSGGFTFNCITGKRDRNNGTWFGIVRAMLDPQMWANKWLSQILHIINTSAKGGLLYEKDAVENPSKLLEDWARPDSAIELKSGALAGGRIQERQSRTYPAGLDKMMSFAVDSLPQVTGINLELLGLVQKEQAGVLEAQRKQAGYAILAVFFDSLRRYRKRQGRVMMRYIQEYISDGRLVRISGEDGAQEYVPLLRDSGTAKYDVIVDDAPMSANQKEQVWAMMTQMLPILQQQPVPMQIWTEFLRYSPLPSSVAEKLANILTQTAQPDPQQQQMEQASQELEMRGKAADAAEKESSAALNAARAESEQAGIFVDMAQAMQPPR